MIQIRSSLFRRLAGVIALCVTVAGLSAAPAQARVYVGVGIPLPLFGPPAYYYPPPVYYPPPPVYLTPPPPVMYTPPVQPQYPAPRAAYGQSCNAGPYVCPMDRPVAAGAPCYCPGNDGRRVGGYAQ
jgi:hypothetical protein